MKNVTEKIEELLNGKLSYLTIQFSEKNYIIIKLEIIDGNKITLLVEGIINNEKYTKKYEFNVYFYYTFSIENDIYTKILNDYQKRMEYFKLKTSNYFELYQLYPDKLQYFTNEIIDKYEQLYDTFTPREKKLYGTLENWINDEIKTIQKNAINKLIEEKGKEIFKFDELYINK